MLDYKYTNVNQLDKPDKYMYSSFHGGDFLDAYFRDRLKYIKNFDKKEEKKFKNKIYSFYLARATLLFQNFLDAELSDQSEKEIIDWGRTSKYCTSSIKDNNIKPLSDFDITRQIYSSNLLSSLINSQLTHDDNSLIKFWLDLLVQRFEVTKKIYESYPHSFRNGEGKYNTVQLYWMFALSLMLFYCKTKNIKYLSTTLKVSDLLCSLDKNLLNDEIPPQGLSIILLVELLNVKLLSRNINGVEIELT